MKTIAKFAASMAIVIAIVFISTVRAESSQQPLPLSPKPFPVSESTGRAKTFVSIPEELRSEAVKLVKEEGKKQVVEKMENPHDPEFFLRFQFAEDVEILAEKWDIEPSTDTITGHFLAVMPGKYVFIRDHIIPEKEINFRKGDTTRVDVLFTMELGYTQVGKITSWRVEPVDFKGMYGVNLPEERQNLEARIEKIKKEKF